MKELHTIKSNGNEYWHSLPKGLYRYDGGPCFVSATGSEHWRDSGGILYREKNHAVISVNGQEIWYEND